MILKKYRRRWDWFWLSPEAKKKLTAIGMSPKQLEEKESKGSCDCPLWNGDCEFFDMKNDCCLYGKI